MKLEQNVCYNQRRCAALVTEYEHQDVSTPTRCSSLEHVSYVSETELTFIQQWKFRDIYITRTKIRDIGDAGDDDGIEKKMDCPDNYQICNNNIYLPQLGCHRVAVVILHVYKT